MIKIIKKMDYRYESQKEKKAERTSGVKNRITVKGNKENKKKFKQQRQQDHIDAGFSIESRFLLVIASSFSPCY
jgi:hypothetical protein